jgi:hypothetical protein
VSRVRQINDADFCSDEHRRRFHALTRSVFNRLLESPEQTAAPVVHPEVEYSARQRRDPAEAVSVAQEPATGLREHSQPKAARVFEIPPAVDHFAACRLEPIEAEEQPEFAEAEGLTPSVSCAGSPVLPWKSGSGEDMIEAIAQRIPESPLSFARPGPLSSTCSLEAAPTGGGRALSRPILLRFSAAGVRAPGLAGAGLIRHACGPGGPCDHRFPERFGRFEFLASHSEVRFNLQSTLRQTRGDAASGYLGLPAPGPVELPARRTEVGTFVFHHRIQLPAAASRLFGEWPRAASAPLDSPHPMPAPQAATQAVAQRLCAGPEILWQSVSFPRLLVERPAFGPLRESGMESRGYPAASKPGREAPPVRPAAFPAAGVSFPCGPRMPQAGRILAQAALLPMPACAAANKLPHWSAIGPQFGGPGSLTKLPALRVEAAVRQFGALLPAIPSGSFMPVARKPLPRFAVAPGCGPGSVWLPSLHAAAWAFVLHSAAPSIQLPVPRARQAGVTWIPEATRAGASTATRLLELPVPVTSARGAPGLQSLCGVAFPAARMLATAVRSAPRAAVQAATVFPNSSAPVGGAHRLLLPPQIQLGLSIPRGEMPNPRSAAVALAARAASLPAGVPAPASARTLMPPEIKGCLAPQAAGGLTRGRSPQTDAATVAVRSTHAAEFQALEVPRLPRELAGGCARLLENRGFDRSFVRCASEWQAFEPQAAEFRSVELSTGTSEWQPPPVVRFLREPERAPRADAAHPLDQSAATEFAVPEVLRPEMTEGAPGLGEASVAKLSSPAIRDDQRTIHRKMRLAFATRLSHRSSRLPVFHAKVEKAHMPCGVFAYVETEDRDDVRTTEVRLSCAPAAFEPVCPQTGCVLRFCGGLDSAELLPVPAGPYSGEDPAAISIGEFPYPPELFVIETGIKLLSTDFEARLESLEPRWRNALKTASGMFRGVMIFLIALSVMLTGCAANDESFRQALQSRAAFHLEHDFSQGLDGWYGGRDWARTWVREPGGGYTVVGQLALYRPSQQFTDYRLEFFGQVGRQSIGWVYRAADLQNYYAAKLVVTKPGPMPAMALLRYQVIDGQETGSVRVPVQIMLHNGRPYRIRQDVDQDGFTTSIDNQVVDFWTDDRLRTGGVGFFGEKGDTPHLYWMKLTHHEDFWGKLCAAIVPND